MAKSITQDSDSAQYWGLVRRLERLESATSPTAWNEPVTYVSPFANYSAILVQYRFAMARVGPWVKMRGLVRTTTTFTIGSNNICTLPADFAPSRDDSAGGLDTSRSLLFNCVAQFSAACIARVEVVNDGTNPPYLMLQGIVTPAGVTGSSGGWIALDPITYLAA